MTEMITLVAVMDRNRVIGCNNTLPWHLPADLKHFKTLTLGKSIIMGRKTFKSIGNKPLPQRQNIIISRQSDFQAPGCTVTQSLDAAIKQADTDEIMIVGGAQIYQLALPLANRMVLTLIDHEFAGDTFFPRWDQQNWQEVAREDHQPDANNPHYYSFVTYDRITPSTADH